MVEFLNIFETLKSKDQKFYDTQFPPNDQSLGDPHKAVWLRLEQILDGNYQIFSQSKVRNRFGLGKWIGSEDIFQGRLGNCYLLAAISSVANAKPDLILNNFITQTVNNQGIFGVRIYVDGVWKIIYVDDYFPTIQNRFIFARPKNKAVWVIILEKVWAKLFSQYAKCEGGYEGDSLNALTGAPTDIFLITEKDKDFSKYFKECLKSGVIMVAGTKNEDSEVTNGIISKHAYTILKLRSIQHPEKGTVKLIKLRNPWGVQEWNGDWGFGSPLWTNELRNELKLANDDKGIFYMPLCSFFKQFTRITACHVKQDYQYSYAITITSKNKAAYFSFSITQPGKYFLSFIQKNERFDNCLKYSTVKLLLAMKIDGNYKYVAGKQGHYREIWCDPKLECGEYIIFTKGLWQYSEENTYTVSCYGPIQVELKQINKVQGIMNSIFLKQALAQKEKRNLFKIQSCYHFDRGIGWGYYFFENQSNFTINSNLHFTQFNGLKLCKPFKGDKLKFKLGPQEQFIVVIKILSWFLIDLNEEILFN